MTLSISNPRAKTRWTFLSVVVGLGLILGMLMPLIALAAPPKISLEQCRNGSAATPNQCLVLGGGTGWQNGNAGASNAHFVEGHSIPYRALLTDAPDGVNTVLLGYDVKHSNVHAIDFLTHYQRLEPHGQFGHGPGETVSPLSGVTMPDLFDTAKCAIPEPSNLSVGASATFEAIKGTVPVTGSTGDTFTVFGASSCSVSQALVDGGTPGDLTQKQSEARVLVTFNATSSTVVMAWGGHIARSADWDSQGAAQISGSPYHMRLKAWSAGNVGNQDRSLSAAAVLSESSGTTTQLQERNQADNETLQSQSGATTMYVDIGAKVRDTATVSPPSATGTVEFRVYGPYTTAAAAISACTANTTPTSAGTNKTVTSGTATSDTLPFTSAGFYAWRAFFTGSGVFEDSQSACSDETLRVREPTSLETSPWVYPNDSATVSASAGGNLAGTLTFGLYDTPTNCQSGGTTGRLYQESVAVSGASPQMKSTSNGSHALAADNYKIEASATVYWRVSFASTNNDQTGRNSICTESINATLVPAVAPGTAPALP